jgi:hypothetical protein
MKLAIALPLTHPFVNTQFLDSWARMEKPVDYVYMRPTYPQNIDAVRNDLVKQALQSGCTNILMIDTDQTYPPDTIVRLMSHNLPIVCGKVHRRYPPFDPILYREVPETGQYAHVPLNEWVNGGLIEVDATGGACMFLDMSVFDDIAYPWFERDEDRGVGEDVNFWRKCRAAGHKIFVDVGIEIGHLGQLEIGKNVYLMYLSMQQAAKGEGSNGQNNGKGM